MLELTQFQDVTIAAGRDVTITTAQQTSSSTFSEEVKRSGLFASGGASITLGKQQVNQDQANASVTNVGSTVASLGGNMTIDAGRQYTQTGSQVLALAGDIDIAAQKVDINAAIDSSRNSSETRFRQSGLTLAVSSPVISAVQATAQVIDATGKTKDRRMKVLGAAMAAMSAKDTADAAQAIAKDPKAGVGLNISIGASRSDSQQEQSSSTAVGSKIAAGGNVTIQATGAGSNSTLDVTGSDIVAGGAANLKTDGAVKLEAAKNVAEQHSTDSSSSASVGVGINFGGSQNGISFSASASKSRGDADGMGVTWTNTHVSGDRIRIQSGGDTTLKGAVVQGDQVTADVKGNLNIESLQDTSTYTSRQQSAGVGVSVCVPPLCAGTSSGSISVSNGKANGDYASVVEQSGIKAGDVGFQINVDGNTDLKGGLIASSDKAIQDGKNSLVTQSLTVSDIENHATASASSSGISLSSDMLTQGKYGFGKAVVGNVLNNGAESGESTGTTRSAISVGAIAIADDAKQQALTGKNGAEMVASLNRDTANSQQAATKQDVEAMKQAAEATQIIKQAVFNEAVKFTDESYRKMFLKEHPMYEVTRDADGVPRLRLLSEEEKQNLQPGPDGKVHIAANGIFNDDAAAAKYALQHASGSGTQYLIHFPEADNTVSELLIAGCQKFLENDFTGLTNSTTQVKDVMAQYGESGLHLDGHSRGSMTIGNAMESLSNSPNAQGSLIGTTVNFFGPAYNAQQGDKLLSNLQNRTALPEELQSGSILKYMNHSADPVGSLIGGNPSTGGTIPAGSNTLFEMLRAATGQKDTTHNCYGDTGQRPHCAVFWSAEPSRLNPVRPLGPLNKVEVMP